MGAEVSPTGSLMLNHAIAYAKQGYSVVQLFAGGKRPTGQWKKGQTQRATEQELIEQWKDHPDANVGIICGQISGVIVVDVDPRNGGSVEEWERKLPRTLSIETGSGGRHFYFRSDVVVRKAKLADGVDLQGEGSLVVVPPSRHESGRTYRIHTDAPIAPVPDFIQHKSHNSEEKPKSLERTWVHDLLTNGAGSGKRNDATNRLAGYFLAKHIPVDIVNSMLLDWNRSRNFPPLGDDEIVRTVESTNRTRESNSQAWTAIATEALAVDNKDANEPVSLMRLDSFMQKYGGEEMRWAVDDWLPQSAIIMATALPGAYKTWLSFDMALSIATGSKFLGQFEAKTRGGVIMLQMEDAFPLIAERLSVLIASKTPDIVPQESGGVFSAQMVDPNIPIYLEPARKFKMTLDEHLYSLIRQIKQRNIKLVIIDPLYAMLEKEDEYGKDLGLLIREKLKPIRDMTGCSFLLVHHAKKSESQNIVGDRTGSWGSVYLDAATEGSWQIRRVPGEKTSVVVSPFFKSMGSSEPIKLKFDIDSKAHPPRFNVSYEKLTGEAATAYQNTQHGVVTDEIVSFCDERGRTVKQIAERFNLPIPRATEIIRKLEMSNKLMREAGKIIAVPSQMKLDLPKF